MSSGNGSPVTSGKQPAAAALDPDHPLENFDLEKMGRELDRYKKAICQNAGELLGDKETRTPGKLAVVDRVAGLHEKREDMGRIKKVWVKLKDFLGGGKLRTRRRELTRVLEDAVDPKNEIREAIVGIGRVQNNLRALMSRRFVPDDRCETVKRVHELIEAADAIAKFAGKVDRDVNKAIRRGASFVESKGKIDLAADSSASRVEEAYAAVTTSDETFRFSPHAEGYARAYYPPNPPNNAPLNRQQPPCPRMGPYLLYTNHHHHA